MFLQKIGHFYTINLFNISQVKVEDGEAPRPHLFK